MPAGEGGTRDDAAAGIKARIAAGETPSRGAMVSLFCGFGMSAAAANREYDRQLAEWVAQGSKPKS